MIKILTGILATGAAFLVAMYTGTSVLDTGVWSMLNIVSALVIPFVIIILSAFGKALWDVHKRLTQIEDAVSQHSETLYGNPDDAMHNGLAQDVKDVKVKVDTIDEKMDTINDYIREKGEKDD